jgi:hypothetical protein
MCRRTRTAVFIEKVGVGPVNDQGQGKDSYFTINIEIHDQHAYNNIVDVLFAFRSPTLDRLPSLTIAITRLHSCL